jgi:hypothetical protein
MVIATLVPDNKLTCSPNCFIFVSIIVIGDSVLLIPTLYDYYEVYCQGIIQN